VQLYSYFRSSASYRVRIALALKGLDYEYLPVQIVKNEQFGAPFDAIAPGHLVPVLKDGDAVLSQSLAIIEYLDEKHPQPELIPREAKARARVRSLSYLIASEIHPINNLRVLQHLKRALGQNEDQINTWYRHWIADGLAKLEGELAGGKGKFCHGGTPTMADCCLVPQIFNAKRYQSDLAPYPNTMRVFETCMQLEAFDRAQPSKQPDAE